MPGFFFQQVFEVALTFVLRKVFVMAYQLFRYRTSYANWNVLGNQSNMTERSLFVLAPNERSRITPSTYASQNNSATAADDNEDYGIEADVAEVNGGSEATVENEQNPDQNSELFKSAQENSSSDNNERNTSDEFHEIKNSSPIRESYPPVSCESDGTAKCD